MEKLSNQEKARRARERIVGELHRRGAINVSVNRQGLVYEIMASSADTGREYTLRVKTKASGEWQTDTRLGEPRHEDPEETFYWILEDRGGEPHTYYVVPNWWMANYIHHELAAHLESHGGRRPVNPRSTHCAIKPRDVAPWRARWDQLGLR